MGFMKGTRFVETLMPGLFHPKTRVSMDWIANHSQMDNVVTYDKPTAHE